MKVKWARKSLIREFLATVINHRSVSAIRVILNNTNRVCLKWKRYIIWSDHGGSGSRYLRNSRVLSFQHYVSAFVPADTQLHLANYAQHIVNLIVCVRACKLCDNSRAFIYSGCVLCTHTLTRWIAPVVCYISLLSICGIHCKLI